MAFQKLLPEGKVDEVAFNASRPGFISVCSLSLESVSVRLRALGHHHPSPLCASASTAVDGQRDIVDGPLICIPPSSQGVSRTYDPLDRFLFRDLPKSGLLRFCLWLSSWRLIQRSVAHSPLGVNSLKSMEVIQC